MTYELVLAIVPPDTLDPVERANELMDTFFHSEDSYHHRQEEDHDEEEDSETYRNEHFWDSAIVGGRYFSGCLWRDRYGLLLPGHPVNAPGAEVQAW